MRALVIGQGHVGSAAVQALSKRGEVITASRSTDPSVDLDRLDSIAELFESIGRVDAVVVCAGSVPFKPLGQLTSGDYRAGLANKVLGQLEVVRVGTEFTNDGGSITLTSGILAREAVATGAVASLANGAIESFVMAAASELPRGIRINAVSPTVLSSAPEYFDTFAGFPPVSPELVGQAYVRAVAGVATGTVIAV